MNEKFDIYFYKTSSDKEVVIEFIERLDLQTQGKIRNAIRLLKEHGLELLTTPWIKKIYKSPSIFELRITGSLQVRLLFFQYDQNTFVVTNAFVKKTNKTPQKEIKLAVSRKKEFI